MTEGTKGLIAMCVAYGIWGLSPLYYAQLKHVPPLEVLSYRCLWSLAFFAVVLLMQRRFALVFAALATPRNLIIIAIAAIRERIRYSNVPPALRGLGMAFLLTGLMGLAFLSLSGIDPAVFGGWNPAK